MKILLTYRHRAVTAEDVAFIRALIAAHPQAKRRELSRRLCVAWNWVQANGALRDMVCRGLMLALHRAALIELPPVRCARRNPLAKRQGQRIMNVETAPLEVSLAQLGALEVGLVRRTPHEALFNSLLSQYHYLGYSQPVGEHLKYLILAQGRPVACLAFSSAPRHLGCRDRFIGWCAAARRRNIRGIAYNTRFLVLPWVKVPHLASHVLGRIVRSISRHWHEVYGHPLYFLETFVDPERFRGTCYRAANWQPLGITTGRGKDSRTRQPNRSIKEVLGYPLGPDFRERLASLTDAP
jgi:Domain of unknown function (DUF4338)